MNFQANPHLNIFLPLLYTVWYDSILSPGEEKAIEAVLFVQDWLSVEERREVLALLDPANPPATVTLQSWKREIQRVTDVEPGDTLLDIGIRLARQNGVTEDFSEAKESFSKLEKQLGLISSEAAYLFKKGHVNITSGYAGKESFNTALMTRLLEGNQAAMIKRVKDVLADPVFERVDDSDIPAYREKVLDWSRILAEKGLGAVAYPSEYGGEGDMEAYFTVMETLSYHDLSLVIKVGVQFGLWGMSIYFLGTEKHHKKYLRDIGTLKLPGCFAMTETGHGSNVKGIETSATYDHAAGTFIIHTPHEHARKEYIGNAAQHGQMATVFAKLVIDGEDLGVNAFVVPLRDEKRNILPGVRIEDCGKKMGLNGVDNGIIYFENVVIPKENMLDKFASVNEEGRFESPIASDKQRFFTMLGTLVGGRIGIPLSALAATKSGLAIAIRYGDQRRQFGPEGGEEVPVLNYRIHQRRLIIPLANAYALHIALQYLKDRFLHRKEEEMQEIEALAAGLKAWGTWNNTATLQECRECCGGKGYLSENRIDALKNDTDVYTTFEGDNTVLMQLVAKSRLSEFKEQFSEMSMFKVLNFLTEKARVAIAEKNPIVVRNTDEAHLADPAFQLEAFRYREQQILSSVARRLKRHIDDGMDSFDAINVSQHQLHFTGMAYIERVILEQFQLQVEKTEDPGCQAVLKKLSDLFALSQIEKHRGWYLEEGYMEGVKTKAIRKLVNQLCWELRQDAVGLVDAFDIPDELLGAEIIRSL